ncbi:MULTISPECIES: hypothetical protein [unclassified Coleofasciculus]|uniref:hypothetical protein n=1 Tax=unclassified Coleofasciculus TaxID=2692782 RepID=UPI00187DF23A|nr:MULTISPECIES: hypothetical protein [unclassified Coleofasciculus]MBE9128693.1 hypothetical protein [Coleofasciculus sp. LEGE 07081]MBE9151479.1 hypothetical protein [Coleofasciculus sp. LEGE 07092]
MMITNGGYDKEKGNAVLASGDADLVFFAKLFLANRDLPHRFEVNAPLNAPNPKMFYGSDEKGYTDPSTSLRVNTERSRGVELAW